MKEIRALFDLIGPFTLYTATIAKLTGVDHRRVQAHVRLGHLVVINGLVVSVRA